MSSYPGDERAAAEQSEKTSTWLKLKALAEVEEGDVIAEASAFDDPRCDGCGHEATAFITFHWSSQALCYSCAVKVKSHRAASAVAKERARVEGLSLDGSVSRARGQLASLDMALAGGVEGLAQGALEACVRALVDAVEALAHRVKPTAPVPAPVPFTAERLDQLEKNCMATYMGGHSGEKLDAFIHGMWTVFNVLRAGVQAVEKAAEQRPRVADQPAPVPTSGVPIWDLVIADMKERDRLGRERYGTPLQAGNGRKALVDAYQESLDQCAYLRQEIEERAARGEHTFPDSEMVDKLVQAGWVIADGLWFQGEHGRAGYGSTAEAYSVMRGSQATSSAEPTEAEMAAELRAEGWYIIREAYIAGWPVPPSRWTDPKGTRMPAPVADAHAAMRAASGRKP